MISEGSCDTEDWSNDDKLNFAITFQNTLKWKTVNWNCNSISQYYCFTVFVIK